MTIMGAIQWVQVRGVAMEKRARALLQKRPEIAGARQQENGMERGAVTKKGPEHGAAMVKRVGAR